MNRRTLISVAVVVVVLSIIGGIWGVQQILNHTSSTPKDLTSLYLTGKLVIPTVNVSTSTAHCSPQDIPTNDPAGNIGAKAIKPHLCSIPTFTEQDVRQYMQTITSFNTMRTSQISPTYTVTRILFITNQVANDGKGLDADTGVDDPNLIVCYVEVYGNFVNNAEAPLPYHNTPTPDHSSSTPAPIFHHGQIVFDGVTGNLLVIGETY